MNINHDNNAIIIKCPITYKYDNQYPYRPSQINQSEGCFTIKGTRIYCSHSDM